MNKPYKYRTTWYVCQVCGNSDRSRERVPAATPLEDLHVTEYQYCGCMDREFYG